MNSQQRRKEYRRLLKKNGPKYYYLKLNEDMHGVFEHLGGWEPRCVVYHTDGSVLGMDRTIKEISQPEYETFVEFGIQTLKTSSLFGPLRLELTSLPEAR
jgi:hypothetical protein